MKKALVLFITILFLVSLFSCGNAAPATGTGEDPAAQTDGGSVTVANPVSDLTEEEAKEIYPRSFRVPTDAENVSWSKISTDDGAVLIQLSFTLDRLSFTAREHDKSITDESFHGMYYDWTAVEPFSFNDRNGNTLSGEYSRFIGENEYADLCVWEDPAAGMTYSLSVTDTSLDGFDLQAIAEEISP